MATEVIIDVEKILQEIKPTHIIRKHTITSFMLTHQSKLPMEVT